MVNLFGKTHVVQSGHTGSCGRTQKTLASLTIGVTGLSQHIWFRSYLPTLFHFVVSGYLIVVGYFHIPATAQR